MPAVTLRDIATDVGVSIMTVSRALRNAPGISEATRKEIHTAARRLKYQPNPYVQALMRSRRKPDGHRATLALVNPWFDLKTYRAHAANRLFFSGIRSRAAALGYGVDLLKLDPSPAGEAALSRILGTRGIRGVIFHWFRDEEASITLDLTKLAAVTVGFSLRQPTLNRIVPDHFGNTRLALDALHRQGYSRVGLILSDRLKPRLVRVCAACALARQEQRAAAIPDLVLDSAFGPAEANEAVAWLRRHRPQVVLCHGKFFGDWLRKHGSTAGSFIVVDLNLVPDEADPADCGIDPDNFTIGERCVEVVASQLMQNNYGPPAAPCETVILGRWTGALPPVN